MRSSSSWTARTWEVVNWMQQARVAMADGTDAKGVISACRCRTDEEGGGEQKEVKSPTSPSTPWTPFTPTMLSTYQGQGRLEEAKLVLESVLENEEVQGVPILILANKQDREGLFRSGENQRGIRTEGVRG